MAVEILLADAVAVLRTVLPYPQWGIFDQTGQAVIVGDSCKAFGFTAEERISKYPIEQGSFASYNKVATPSEPRLQFTVGGTQANRANFLAACEAAKQSLYLFVAVTPEAAYPNMNVVHYDYDRGREDANFITVDVWLEEVRQAPSLSFTNTQMPDGAGRVNLGPIQVAMPGSQTTLSQSGTTTGIISTSAPTTSITSASGNQLPAGISPVGSTVTYLNDDGNPVTGTVQSVSTVNGQLNGYNLTDGSRIGLNNVTGIAPAGSGTVQ